MIAGLAYAVKESTVGKPTIYSTGETNVDN